MTILGQRTMTRSSTRIARFLSSKILTVENYEVYVLPNQADGKIEDLVLVPSLRPGQDAEYMEVVIASAGAVKNENNKYLYYRTDAQSQ